MFGITKPNFFRGLMDGEIRLARDVFHGSLPPWNTIGITNGLNGDGGPWTVDRSWGDLLQGAPDIARSPLKYLIGFGNNASKDLSQEDPDTLMHEMTHVWQYRHYGSSAVSGIRCLYAQKNLPIVKGAGYEYKAGDPFCNYNLEQQAHIVENWTAGGMKEEDELFPYIHYVIRGEGEYRGKRKFGTVEVDEVNFFDLAQLKVLMGASLHEPVEYPNPTMSQDDSFVRIPGDALFDFDKFALKPSAESMLKQAATTILHSAGATSGRLDRVLINGHTDSSGGEEYNLKLSWLRADSVSRWFSSHGYLPQSVMRVQAFGKSQPIPGADPAKNRRVEIYVVNR